VLSGLNEFADIGIMGTDLDFKLDGMAPLLQVYDMPVSIRFYRDVLGFEVIAMNDGAEGDDADWVHLRISGAELMLNTAYERDKRPPLPLPEKLKAHGDTSLYFGCKDIKKAHERLSNFGIAHEGPLVTGYGWDAIHFFDPDGYTICLHWPK
jgi:glyoxylase I family protein